MSPKLIIALDAETPFGLYNFMDRCAKHCGMFKIGSTMFTKRGPEVLANLSRPFFLDLKWHDIPTTVRDSVKAALPLQPQMLSVHAAGGAKMISVARIASEEAGAGRPKIIAVTVLTSDGNGSRLEMTYNHAIMALNAGADGVTCSGRDVAGLRELLNLRGEKPIIVCPGIRPSYWEHDDQVSTATPRQAILEGADYVVVGRPISYAADPGEAARRIAEEIEACGT